jgi:hypothetical protein
MTRRARLDNRPSDAAITRGCGGVGAAAEQAQQQGSRSACVASARVPRSCQYSALLWSTCAHCVRRLLPALGAAPGGRNGHPASHALVQVADLVVGGCTMGIALAECAGTPPCDYSHQVLKWNHQVLKWGSHFRRCCQWAALTGVRLALTTIVLAAPERPHTG